MTEERIFEQLVPIFREVFDDDTLVPVAEMTAADVAEWDSISHIRLILSIEEFFKITFTTAEVAGFTKVGDVVRSIKGKVPT